eukprot:1392341-Amphidinium_carterae.1
MSRQPTKTNIDNHPAVPAVASSLTFLRRIGADGHEDSKDGVPVVPQEYRNTSGVPAKPKYHSLHKIHKRMKEKPQAREEANS